MTIPFVGATKDGTSNKHFGYIFGASGYISNEDYVPASLKEVIITGGTIGDYAFYGCSGLTRVILPGDLTNIGSSAFYNCSNLTSIIIPLEVTSIGSSAFSGCSGLTSINTIYSKQIGAYAFKDCTALTSVAFGRDITFIGAYAFQNCNNLKSVTFDNPESWYVVTRESSSATSGIRISNYDLSKTNPAKAAELLTQTYCDKYWKRAV